MFNKKAPAKKARNTKVDAKDLKANTELTRSEKMAAYYAKKLVGVENELLLVSNSIVEPRRTSFGVLQLDWLFGGGMMPGMYSMAGEEASGKTTTVYHALANAIKVQHLPYTGMYDAEGSVSPKYTAGIWAPFGLDTKLMLSKAGRELGFYYFRNNVIEKMFDYLKRTLSLMPDKNWSSEADSWAYYFPKRDDHFKELMQIMDMRPSKALSTGPYYVCPTDNDGPEGFFSVDSFAGMLTREDEDVEDTNKSGRNAKEASAFATHLKRVKVDLAEKKITMLGTNQLGSHVRQQYGSPDDQFYEKGGNALKFYSDGRGRTFSRSPSSATKHGPFTYDKDSAKFGIEESVEYAGGTDRYAYKEVKNTKNKFGKPGLKTLIRIWVSDARGKPRGIDPVFDVFMHLRNTGQIGKKGKSLVFRLRKTLGKERAGRLNAATPFSFATLKKLVIAEYTGNRDLLREAVKELGIDFRPNLREALFLQMKRDEDLWSNIRDAALTEEEDMEDSDAPDDYESL